MFRRAGAHPRCPSRANGRLIDAGDYRGGRSIAGVFGRAAARRVLLVVCVVLFVVSVAQGAPRWSRVHQLVAPSVQTFSPELAVNHAGVAVAAWYSGPGPPVSAGPGPIQAGTKWTGNPVVVALGSIGKGFRRPVVIARSGTDVQGLIKVALSGSGVAYVAWVRSTGHGAMIWTARDGHLAGPRRLALPRHDLLARLAAGLDGPVDALSYRPNGHGFTFFCTQLNGDGTSGRSFIALHPYKADPCGLPYTGGMNGSIPPHPRQPPGYQFVPQTVVSRNDAHGRTLALWDDWGDHNGYTHGIFYAVGHA